MFDNNVYKVLIICWSFYFIYFKLLDVQINVNLFLYPTKIAYIGYEYIFY